MKHLSTLNKYFWKYRCHLLGGIVFVVLTNYFSILSPQLTGYVVNTVVHTIKTGDSATKARDSISTVTYNKASISDSTKSDEKNYDILVRTVIKKFDEDRSRPHKILFAGLTLLVLAIISGFFMFLMRQTIIVMSRHIEYDQKNEIFSHYLLLDTHFY